MLLHNSSMLHDEIVNCRWSLSNEDGVRKADELSDNSRSNYW